MNETVAQLVEMFFNLVLVPVLIYGLKLAGDYLKAKTENDKLHTAIEMAEKAVISAVNETSQTFVDVLKAEGKFDEEAAERAAILAFDRAKAILGGEAEKLLKHSMVDVNEFILSKIEEIVRKNKLADAAAKAIVTTPLEEITAG